MRLKHALIATAVLVLTASGASAHVRHSHHHHRHHRAHSHRHFASRPVDIRPHAQVNSERLLKVARNYIGMRHSPSGFRGEWCADYLAFVARKVGVRTPANFRLARAWANAGPRVNPQRGAIVVFPHHVGLVQAVSGNRILMLSGNFSHSVREAWVSMRTAIAYVLPI